MEINQCLTSFLFDQTSARSRGVAIPNSDRPGAKITWLTAARSGLGGQVILNDKGKLLGGGGRQGGRFVSIFPDCLLLDS